jgi:nitrite reductase (NADH) small subunit
VTRKYKLGLLTQIPAGEGRTFKLGENEIAVFRTRNDEIFATQSKCPHKGGPLADGLVGNKHLICPLHELRFDLTTGHAVGSDACISVYSVSRDTTDELTVELPGD